MIERNQILGITENIESIRERVKKLNDKELENSLHKIIDVTLKGVHIKNISVSNNPQDILRLLEVIFTKLYKLPIEEENIT